MESQIGAFKENEELTQLEPLANADAGKYMDNYDPVYSYTPPYYIVLIKQNMSEILVVIQAV